MKYWWQRAGMLMCLLGAGVAIMKHDEFLHTGETLDAVVGVFILINMSLGAFLFLIGDE